MLPCFASVAPWDKQAHNLLMVALVLFVAHGGLVIGCSGGDNHQGNQLSTDISLDHYCSKVDDGGCFGGASYCSNITSDLVGGSKPPSKMDDWALVVAVVVKVAIKAAAPTVLRLSSLGGLIKNQCFCFCSPPILFLHCICSIDLIG